MKFHLSTIFLMLVKKYKLSLKSSWVFSESTSQLPGKVKRRLPQILFFANIFFSSCCLYRDSSNYRNFRKETHQNLDSERATIAENQLAIGNQNSTRRLLSLKTDSPDCNESAKKTEISKHVADFLNNLLFVESGIYTLWGNKPMTEIMIYQGTDMQSEDVPKHIRDQCIFVEDHSFEQLKSWREFSKNSSFPRFRFIERSSSEDPSTLFFLFVNLKETNKIFENYKNRFVNTTQMDLSFEQALNELTNENSIFWKRVNEDHYLKGLLFGFGENNVRYFLNHKGEKKYSNTFGIKEMSTFTKDHFPIPVYACASPSTDAISIKYRKQREKIKKIYKNKDMVEVTLKELQR